MAEEQVVNVNIGVLGHVDSGKTSFCGVVSTVLSVAALDKSPQSQERGITQDLQFSAFRVPKATNESQGGAVEASESNSSSAPSSTSASRKTVFNFTLVDCPGHASLIRTIIGGSSIIDRVILVIDATKGIQTQTAEGIIIAELVTTHVIVLLNKVDLVPEAERETRINLLKTRIGKVLSGARFSKVDFIPFSTKTKVGEHFFGFEALMDTLSKVDIPKRNLTGSPLLMSVDHCFTLKGKGSVATGTLLRGTLAPNQMVEVVGHVSPYKIKSIEMFKSRMQQVTHGDRAGVLIPNLDSTLLERGLICHPGSVSHTDGLVVTLNKIRYYKHEVESGMKLHVSIGHSTVLGKITLFEDTTFLQSVGILTNASDAKNDQADDSSKTREIRNPYGEMTAAELAKLDLAKPEFPYLKSLTSERPFCLALIHLERSIPVPADSIYIASKLDADIHATSCRLAFHGRVISSFTQDAPSTSTTTSISAATSSSKKDLREIRLQDLKVITTKEKRGAIDRIVDDYVLIGRSLFKKETKMALFIGLDVTVDGKKGVIDSSFGASGKFKVRFSSPIAKTLPLDAPIILVLKKQKFATNVSAAKK